MVVYKSLGEFKGNKRVFIAIPVMDGFEPGCVASLFGAKEALLKNNIDSEISIFAGNCHVDDSRNRLVRDFLESDCDEMIFIDADVRFDPDDLVTLAKFDVDVVGGIYPLKSEEEDYPVLFKEGEIWSNEQGLIEVEKIPAGFSKIKRDVFEKIYETVPKFKTKSCRANQKLLPLIYERSLSNYTRLGGDYEFCRKWKELGGEIYIYPEFYFGHVGHKEYEGSVGHWLRRKNGVTNQNIERILQKIYRNDYTPSDITQAWRDWGSKWAAPPDLVCLLASLAEKTSKHILECGSGISSAVLGAIAARKGIEVASMEHDLEWAARIKPLLGGNNSLYTSRLINGFYSEVPEGVYSLVFIDGPPREGGDRNKIVDYEYMFTDDCVVVVDDVDTELDGPMKELEKIGYKFKTYGRYAIGGKNARNTN